jgi:DNA polymerase-1
MQGLQKRAGRDDAHVLLQASNAPIQGTSADLLKAALIQLHQQLSGPPYYCRLLLTVRLLEIVPKAVDSKQSAGPACLA